MTKPQLHKRVSKYTVVRQPLTESFIFEKESQSTLSQWSSDWDTKKVNFVH